MRFILILSLFVSVKAYGQLTLERAQDSLRKYHLGTSTYFDGFRGHTGYGAAVVLTKDGGAAGFGDGDYGTELIRLDKNGNYNGEKVLKTVHRNRTPLTYKT